MISVKDPLHVSLRTHAALSRTTSQVPGVTFFRFAKLTRTKNKNERSKAALL
jgi:hypothetical protein